jgi:hypothetical protein
MNNGVQIPLGKEVSYVKDGKGDHITSMPEYVVYDNSQIRMRYLIQIEK